MKSVLHPNWSRPPLHMVDGFSLEITAKDADALRAAAPLLPPDTPVAVTFLPGETVDQRLAATRLVRDLGFEPMPHFSARRIESRSAFQDYLDQAVEQARVRRCFVIAGDPAEAEGPFADSAALIGTGAFERAGIMAIGVGGHPEGHPAMSREDTWRVLAAKCDDIVARGMAPLIVTQFAFDADPLLAWVKEARRRGIDAPVRLGVPGPAGIKTLVRFAARCGVGASSAVLSKYGISIGKLLGQAGPDRLVENLGRGLTPEHGAVRLHFYPFGGLEKTAAWINQYAATRN
ncbi:methylenetetrahydrofolate reductase [Sphingomonas sp.]|uniref:methylenetetrahydrofolate reductase n=1 Tax=Sphingomonas sp. TaxID=28214 RepID=UPI0031DC5CFC